jgi:hypothetical protein
VTVTSVTSLREVLLSTPLYASLNDRIHQNKLFGWDDLREAVLLIWFCFFPLSFLSKLCFCSLLSFCLYLLLFSTLPVFCLFICLSLLKLFVFLPVCVLDACLSVSFFSLFVCNLAVRLFAVSVCLSVCMSLHENSNRQGQRYLKQINKY